MNDKFSDELISAYLDGELTADEQVAVERELRENPEARRMFDELQTLRANLQSLPRHSLDESFSQRVLRRAERVMLTPSSAPSPVEPTKAAALSPAVVAASREREATQAELRRWRRLFWGAATIAAGLLVVLCLPERFAPRSVVQNTNGEAKPMPHMAAVADHHVADAPKSPSEATNAPFAPAADTNTNAATLASEKGASENRAAAAASPAPVANQPEVAERAKEAATKSAAAPHAGKGGASQDALRKDVDRQEDEITKKNAGLDRSPTSDQKSYQPQMGGGRAGFGGVGEAARGGDAPAAGGQGGGGQAFGGMSGKAAEEDRLGARRGGNALAADATKIAGPQNGGGGAPIEALKQLPQADVIPGELVVVRLKLAAGDPQRQKQAVETLLAKNDIDVMGEARRAALERSTPNANRRMLRDGSDKAGNAREKPNADAKGEEAGDTNFRSQQEQQQAANGTTAKGAGANGNVELFYVEASSEQIASTLKGMSQLEGIQFEVQARPAAIDEKPYRKPKVDKDVDHVPAKEQKAEETLSEAAAPAAPAAPVAPVATGAVPQKSAAMAKKMVPLAGGGKETQAAPFVPAIAPALTAGAAGGAAPPGAAKPAAAPLAPATRGLAESSQNAVPQDVGLQAAGPHVATPRGRAIRVPLPNVEAENIDALSATLAASEKRKQATKAEAAAVPKDGDGILLAGEGAKGKPAGSAQQEAAANKDNASKAEEGKVANGKENDANKAAEKRSPDRVRVLFVIEFGE